MSATIKDVAKRAKVSISTVSLVINNNPRISESTRQRVLKAIRDLNYYPRRAARGLVSHKTGNIGFILTEDHFSRHEPFYTRIFLGTEFEARELEYYILLTTVHPDFKPTSRLPRFILERNVDGVIFAGKVPDPLIQLIEARGIPVVFVDYHPPQGSYPAVLIDNVSGGILATQHLIDCGRRRIGFLGGDFEHPSIYDRYQGYRQALERNLIPFKDQLVVTDEPYPDRVSGYQAMGKLLAKAPDVDAIFACNDAMALGALQYLKEKHRNVPEEISIMGFDDVEADLTVDPRLSTIRVNKEELGIQAIRLMIEILNSNRKLPRKILVPVELIERESTCSISEDR